MKKVGCAAAEQKIHSGILVFWEYAGNASYSVFYVFDGRNSFLRNGRPETICSVLPKKTNKNCRSGEAPPPWLVSTVKD